MPTCSGADVQIVCCELCALGNGCATFDEVVETLSAFKQEAVVDHMRVVSRERGASLSVWDQLHMAVNHGFIVHGCSVCGLLRKEHALVLRHCRGEVAVGKVTPSISPFASQVTSRRLAGSPVDLAPNSSMTLGAT